MAKLEELPADKFQPNLVLLEKLIQSLEIQKAVTMRLEKANTFGGRQPKEERRS